MRTYRVYCCVVDLQPETHLARDFAARWRSKVWLCRYHNRATSAAWDRAERLVTVDRTIAFDALFQGFRDGRATLPANARDLGGEVRDNAGAYYRQLCSLTRTAVQDASGNALFRYSKTGDDHFAHAENYCALALSQLPRSKRPAFNADYGQGFSRLANLPGAFHGGSRLEGLPGRPRPDYR